MVLYGVKGRVALIIPHEDYTTEYEFNRLAPKDVAFYTVRMLLKSVSREGLVEMSRELDSALDRAPARVNLAVYHCTSGTFILGPKWEEDILRRIEGRLNVASTSTMRSVVEALKHLGLSKISLATPYTKELNDYESNYLLQFGIRVVKDSYLSLTSSEAMCSVERDELKQLVERADTSESQGIFISCTGLKTMGLIDEFEETFRKPVVSSNSATFWNVLRLCGIGGVNIRGYGKLLMGGFR
jgi:maleate isomerase